MQFKFTRKFWMTLVINSAIVGLIDLVVLGGVLFYFFVSVNNYGSEAQAFYGFSIASLIVAAVTFGIKFGKQINPTHFISVAILLLFQYLGIVYLMSSTDFTQTVYDILMNLFLLFIAVSLMDVVILGYRKLNILIAFVVAPLAGIVFMFWFMALVGMAMGGGY